MTVPASEQSKRTMCIALYNRDLHANNCCPGNYDVEYSHGWFHAKRGTDETQIFRKPQLTAEADQKLAEGYEVLYSDVWNTFVLGDIKEPE